MTQHRRRCWVCGQGWAPHHIMRWRCAECTVLMSTMAVMHRPGCQTTVPDIEARIAYLSIRAEQQLPLFDPGPPWSPHIKGPLA